MVESFDTSVATGVDCFRVGLGKPAQRLPAQGLPAFRWRCVGSCGFFVGAHTALALHSSLRKNLHTESKWSSGGVVESPPLGERREETEVAVPLMWEALRCHMVCRAQHFRRWMPYVGEVEQGKVPPYMFYIVFCWWDFISTLSLGQVTKRGSMFWCESGTGVVGPIANPFTTICDTTWS